MSGVHPILLAAISRLNAIQKNRQPVIASGKSQEFRFAELS